MPSDTTRAVWAWRSHQRARRNLAKAAAALRTALRAPFVDQQDLMRRTVLKHKNSVPPVIINTRSPEYRAAEAAFEREGLPAALAAWERARSTP